MTTLSLNAVTFVRRDPDWIFRELHDPETLLNCVPGATLTKLGGRGSFEARIAFGLGPFKSEYKGKGRIVAACPQRKIDQQRAKFLLDAVPMKLDVMVAVDDGERVPVCNEASERLEDNGMARSDRSELQSAVVGAVAQAVLAFLVACLGVELAAARQNRHSDEIDEVARDDQAPALSRGRRPPVMREQAREVGVDELRAASAIPGQIVQVVAEMNVRQDKQALVERWRDQLTLTLSWDSAPSKLPRERRGQKAGKCVSRLCQDSRPSRLG